MYDTITDGKKGKGAKKKGPRYPFHPYIVFGWRMGHVPHYIHHCLFHKALFYCRHVPEMYNTSSIPRGVLVFSDLKKSTLQLNIPDQCYSFLISQV